ncbi:YraN family protein [Anatilimnocola floriformis]|uniref:YraN family protein n=1 Tax=Anatilimnocola floriformis TaxID=2948575 RepID=UPI0020C4116C|nr:YraN family protein [Anatilimnocola floriformis]
MSVWQRLGDLIAASTQFLQTWRNKWFAPLSFGQLGERAAAKYLRRLRYTIIAHGERDQFGEIDLIAVDGRTVVFVEVKTRSAHDGGHPADAVDAEKQRRLTRAASAYRRRHDLMETAARFDVIAITWPEAGKGQPVIEHFKNAFEARD